MPVEKPLPQLAETPTLADLLELPLQPESNNISAPVSRNLTILCRFAGNFIVNFHLETLVIKARPDADAPVIGPVTADTEQPIDVGTKRFRKHFPELRLDSR
jgi:hypothetical protein